MNKKTIYSYFKITILSIFFLQTTACATLKKQPETKTSDLKSTSKKIARCQLPGKIKKLGNNFSYLARGQIIQISQSTCHIRGGKIIS